MSSLGDLYTHLKTLCEQWFYNKSTIDGYLNNKISKSDTVGLVKNDGSIDTNTYLTSASLSGYEQTSNKTSTWNSTTNNTRYPTEKLVKDSLDLKANSSSLSSVATSGSYTDLSNKPTIPSDVSDLTDTQNTTFTPKSHSHGNLSNDGKIGSNANYFVYTTTGGAVTSKQKIGNITTDGKVGTTANLPLITTTNGVVTTGSFGTSANSFCEGNDSRLSDARIPTSHPHGFIQNDGTITEIISTYDKANLPLIEENGRIKLGVISGDYIKSDNDLVNLRVSASTNLNSVLGSIDTAIGNLSSINAINIVTTLPTASVDTMNKLYIVSENSKVNVYYTERSGTSPNYTYSWHKMDTDILDELSINWSDIQNNPFSSASPSDYATSSHTHGNLSNDGKVGSNANYFVYTTTGGAITSKQKIGNITTGGAIGSTANKPIITTTNGALTTGSFGTTANTFCQGNDSRLSDARTPTSHSHGNVSNDGKVTTTGTSGGNIVITTSTDAVAVDTTINVIDALVQDLITYGSS